MRVHLHDSDEDRGPERARRFGRRFAGPMAAAAAAYRQQFRDLHVPDAAVTSVVRGAWDALCSFTPEVAAELENLAAGAGAPLADVVAVTARTEVLALAQPVDECSTAVRLTPGGPVAFQTWDWHEHLVPDAMVWTYRTDRGRRVTVFTEPGMPAKIGMNDAGLSLNFNILHHRSDGISCDGVPVHAIARRILDDAECISDAVEIAASVPVSASSVFTVASGSDAAAIEVSPAGAGVVRPNPDGWLIHTNHFLDPGLASGGMVSPGSTTDARFDHLANTVARPVPTECLASIAHDLGGRPGSRSPICLRPDLSLPRHARWQTLLTVRIAPSDGVFEWWAGDPSSIHEAETAATRPPPPSSTIDNGDEKERQTT